MDRSATLEREDWIEILRLISDKCEREHDKNNLDEVFRLLDVYRSIYNQTLIYDFSNS